MPPVLLIAVVAVSLAGRIAGRGPTTPSEPSAGVAAAGTAEPSARVAFAARPGNIVAPAPVATPSPRSDWPAAIAARRAEPVNRFTRDDVRISWSGFDSTPPWVRRLGALSGFVTDPYER